MKSSPALKSLKRKTNGHDSLRAQNGDALHDRDFKQSLGILRSSGFSTNRREQK